MCFWPIIPYQTLATLTTLVYLCKGTIKKTVDNNTIIWAYANNGEVKISNVKIESTSEAARSY